MAWVGSSYCRINPKGDVVDNECVWCVYVVLLVFAAAAFLLILENQSSSEISIEILVCATLLS